MTLSFPLAVCHQCLPTINRRPLSTLNKVFLTALIIAGAATFVLMAVTTNQIQNAFVQGHIWLVSILAGGGASALWFGLRRPRLSQTSFYQPVRVKKLKRKFRDGEIRSMTLGFTNEEYLEAFSQLNAGAIEKGFLKAVKA
jgi:hypothetical protein